MDMLIEDSEDNEKTHNNFYCPDDIWVDIFTRVPANRLRVFKRVCHNWRVLISSYDFLKLHLKKAQKEAINKPTMFVDNGKNNLILMISRQGGLTHLLQNLKGKLKQCNASDAIGSCDGLVLFPIQSEQRSLIVNPITQETRLVAWPNEEGYTCCIFFDRFEDDYKLLHLFPGHLDCPHDDYIYSFKRDEWSRLISVKTQHGFLPILDDPPVVVADSLHWIGFSSLSFSMMVLVFKIETKEFSFVPYLNCCLSLGPGNPNHDNDESMQLIEKDGQLGLCHTITERNVIEIWFLQHYGNWGSWARKFTINCDRIGLYRSMPRAIKIVSFMNDEDVLLAWSCVSYRQFYLYNLETKNIKLDRGGHYVCTPLTLTLTLLSPNNVYSTL